jgi:UDP-N-acetylglucosamine:LPS N-acetylglucosamine transferase
MRGLNIARAIRERAPAADILFYTRNASAAELCGREFRYVVAPDTTGPADWAAQLARFAPDAIVYDTLLPNEHDAAPVTRAAYIMRKCKPERQLQIFASTFVGQVALVLIPHTPDEFGYSLPSTLAHKSYFVGPIVRQPGPAAQAAVCRRYGISPADFVLVSTPGGGGFADDAAAFFATVRQVHQRLAALRPNLRHLVIKGPHFQQPLAAPPGMTVVAYEPELVSLFARADLVIAEGGYNTVNELRVAQAPAIFLPGERSYDDQAERVRGLQRRGLAAVFEQRGRAAAAIAALAANDAWLGAARARYAGDQITLGNRAAAEHILALAVA